VNCQAGWYGKPIFFGMREKIGESVDGPAWDW